MIDYIPAKTILSGYMADNKWFGCNYKMNIYKGCCHGCIYCDSRSDCYRVSDFDQVRAKENALELIRNELRSKKRTGVIGTGAMSDPYNPFEKELLLTRHSLELIHAYEFGIAIATKSPLITRDIDILCDITQHSPVLCKITITTADDALGRIIEPGAAAPSARFNALKQLSDAGIFCGVLLMPSLPFITDTEQNIMDIVEKCAENGAKFIYASLGMTLRANQRDYYFEQLDKHFPHLKDKYVRTYGNKYSCVSPRARKLWGIFAASCQRNGLLYKMSDIIKGYKFERSSLQLSLFDQL